MKTEKDIAAALRALAEHDARMEASPDLEARVLREFHRRKPVPRFRLAGWHRLQSVRPFAAASLIALAMAAMIVVAILALRHPRAESIVKQAPRIAAPAMVEAPAVITAAANVKPARKRARPRELMTPFFPLLDAPPPVDRGELLRVNVPASTMRAVGLPVADERLADRVQADVLVSEEGLATAIRFVKYQ